MAIVNSLPSVVIADAGPIIHLDELSALDVLSDYSQIIIPTSVWNEIKHHRPQALENTSISLTFQETLPISR